MIQGAEALTHFKGNPAAQGFVTAAPDQDAGMVLIPLVGGFDPIQHGCQPFLPVAGQRVFQGLFAAGNHVPDAVRLHVVFSDHVQAQLIA